MLLPSNANTISNINLAHPALLLEHQHLHRREERDASSKISCMPDLPSKEHFNKPAMSISTAHYRIADH